MIKKLKNTILHLPVQGALLTELHHHQHRIADGHHANQTYYVFMVELGHDSRFL